MVTTSSRRTARRSAIIWSLLFLLLAPLVLPLILRLEKDRNVRLLKETGATLSVGLDSREVVGVEFNNTQIDAAMVRLLLRHPTIRRLAFTDCRFDAGVFKSLSDLSHLDTFELTRPTLADGTELAELLAEVPLLSITLNDCPDEILRAPINTERLYAIRLETHSDEPAGPVERLAGLPNLQLLTYTGTPLPLRLCQQICREHPELVFEITARDICELRPLTERGFWLSLDDRLHVTRLVINNAPAEIPADTIELLSTLKQISVRKAVVDTALIETLSRFENLQSLSLAHCRLEDERLTPLASLAQLRELNLDDVTTQSGAPVLLPSLPRLRSLVARSPAVTDESFAAAEFPSLKKLNVSGALTARQLSRLLASEKIRTLILTDQHLNRKVLETIAACSKLHHLELFNCSVNDRLLRDISFPESLEILHLSSTRTRRATIDALQSSHPQLKIVRR